MSIITITKDNFQREVKVGKVNIDEQPELAEWFGVMTIPTLILMEQGRIAGNTVGLKPKGELMKLLSQ